MRLLIMTREVSPSVITPYLRRLSVKSCSKSEQVMDLFLTKHVDCTTHQLFNVDSWMSLSVRTIGDPYAKFLIFVISG